MPQKRKFTRIPKVPDLIAAGVPVETIPTYACLADHANNRTGECWPSMNRLAEILGRSVRTIQRHLHALKELGLIEFVERRRHKGRFSSYLYRIVFFVRTTGHQRPAEERDRIYKRTKRIMNSSKEDQKEGVWESYDREITKKREGEAKRRVEGFEWLFGKRDKG